jgi:predicted pyridoxine 5'-phosphate oxidase superfamily flavin-nucleotide-binding protein
MQGKEENDLFHEGEIEAQRRFQGDSIRNAQLLGAMIRDNIPPSWAEFLESQPFFFIATANHRGQCDCSFRGREFNASGQPYSLLKVVDAKTLVFPDYSGNKLYNSLGNILVNPHIGMLFVDFQSRSRARVNGTAEIIEDKDAYSEIWPLALRYVGVTVEQAYPNCKARVPKMTLAPLTDAFFDE